VIGSIVPRDFNLGPSRPVLANSRGDVEQTSTKLHPRLRENSGTGRIVARTLPGESYGWRIARVKPAANSAVRPQPSSVSRMLAPAKSCPPKVEVAWRVVPALVCTSGIAMSTAT
jgi:hypothetical protein